jgi:hypothetical protein
MKIKSTEEIIDMNDDVETKASETEESSGFSTQFKKFNQLQWNLVEKRIDPGKKAVLNALQVMGSGTKINTTEDETVCCGEESYLYVRDKVVARGLIPKLEIANITGKTVAKKGEKKGGKKIQKKAMSADEIRLQNKMKVIVKEFDDIIETFTPKDFNPTFGFSRKYAESRLLTFIYLLHYFSSENITNSSKYELIAGTIKILRNLATLPNISKTVLADVQLNLDNLMDKCKFDYLELCNKYPRLILSTKYDAVFPNMAIQPYHSQQMLMNAIKRDNECGGLYIYKAMIGSGKTSWIIAWCSYIQTIRMTQKATGKMPVQIIFACNLQTVRHQVCQMAWNQEIPFGISVMDDTGARIINNFNARDETRILIVSDLDSAYSLLQANSNYVLFLDEPTVGADQPNNPITESVCKILTVAPKQTILSSATFPDHSEVPNIVADFKKRHPDSTITSIVSKESNIGCTVIRMDGTTLLPHDGCKDAQSLLTIVTNLRTKPFIDRFYTAPVVYGLKSRMAEVGIEDTVDIEAAFKEKGILQQTDIQKIAISLLERLAQENNSVITNVCLQMNAIKLGKDVLIKKDDSDSDDNNDPFASDSDEESDEIEDGAPVPYNLDQIFTKEAHRYAGPYLVVIDNPMEFAINNSTELFEGVPTAKKLTTDYSNTVEKLKQAADKQFGMKGKEFRIKDEDKRSQAEQEYWESNNALIAFPRDRKVNTARHIMKYSPQIKDSMDLGLVHPEYSIETLPLYMPITHDRLMLLLFAGIGVYSPTNLSSEYTDTVLSFASEGKLACTVADMNIAFGTDIPLSHEVICDSLAQRHSINTLFQLMGRVGRVGTSWVAYIHVEEKTADRIMAYVQGTLDTGIAEEAINLNSVYKQTMDKKNSESEQIDAKKTVKMVDTTEKVATYKLTTINKVIEESQKKEGGIDSWIELDDNWVDTIEEHHFGEKTVQLKLDPKPELRSEKSKTDYNNGHYVDKSNNDRNHGDRPPRSSNDRNYGDRPPRSSNDRNYGDRPPRSSNDRNHGDRPPRSSNDRNYGDRPPRSSNDRNHGDRPPRSSNDRNYGDRQVKPANNRNYGDMQVKPANKKEYPTEELDSNWRNNDDAKSTKEGTSKYLPPHFRGKK